MVQGPLEVKSSTILDRVGSNQFLSGPWLCSARFPPISEFVRESSECVSGMVSLRETGKEEGEESRLQYKELQRVGHDSETK